MMGRRIVLLIGILLASILFSVSGCSDSRCEQAKLEAEQAIDASYNLERDKENLERKLWYEYSDYCSSIVENKDLLDSSADEIYCKDWEERGRPTSAVTLNNSEFARLTNEIDNEKRRWAITVTTYKDCFEPSQVISGEEILRG